MTIKEALKKYPQDETELFLSHLLKLEKSDLYVKADKNLTAGQQTKLASMVKQFHNGKPVAYILGYKYFYGLKFKVSQDTLIPRSETEWIIDKTLELSKRVTPAKILDIGTGSGCIAITLAKHLPKSKVIATDISIKALAIAKQNSKSYKAKTKFIKTNLLPNSKDNFDIIIANLPYVPKDFYKENLANLKYEPKSALVDKTENGGLYIKLLKQMSEKGLQPKYIIFEIDPELVTILKTTSKNLFPKAKLKFFKDLHNLIRYSIIDFQ